MFKKICNVFVTLLPSYPSSSWCIDWHALLPCPHVNVWAFFLTPKKTMNKGSCGNVALCKLWHEDYDCRVCQFSGVGVPSHHLSQSMSYFHLLTYQIPTPNPIIMSSFSSQLCYMRPSHLWECLWAMSATSGELDGFGNFIAIVLDSIVIAKIMPCILPLCHPT